MPIIKKIILSSVFINVSALADINDFIGTYKGDGRACHGEIFIHEKSIEWHASFSKCKSTPYKIFGKNINEGKSETVFLLEHNKTCDFEIITVSSNPEDVGFITVIGYGSLDDYKNKSDDILGCRMKKIENKK